MKLLQLVPISVAGICFAVAVSCSAPENGCEGPGCAVGVGGNFNGTGAVSSVGGTGLGAAAGVGGTFVGTGSTSGNVGGGFIGIGSSPGAGGGGPGAGGTGSGGTDPGGPIGGYHVHGDWAGFAFTFATADASIAPADFGDMVDQDGPYCVKGTVAGTPDVYGSIAALGFNTNQQKVHDAEVGKVASTGDGVYIDLEVKSGTEGIRIQIEDGTDPEAADAAEHRWCVNLTGSQARAIPWSEFDTECWDAESGTPYDGREIAKVIIYVPDGGIAGDLPFDFCVNDIGPDNVVGRGTGEVVASCGNNVSWNGTGTNQQFQNFATSDNKYQFQSNGWNLMGGGHSISLLPGAGFKMDQQSCNTSTDAPCSFPSIYIGTDADGERTSGNGLPKQVSQITSIPTCLGWSSGGSPASDEYNVAYDVWFNSDPNATYASQFLMVWYRDPPSFQPGGMFPAQNGVVIGDHTWSVWRGPNHAQQDVVSYVSPSPLADGQAYAYDLKDFIDDAVERGYLSPSLHLISVMGGFEIWGGAQGASVTGFRAEVQ